jgi:hypothetical protein
MSEATYMRNIVRKIVILTSVVCAGCAVAPNLEDDLLNGLEGPGDDSALDAQSGAAEAGALAEAGAPAGFDAGSGGFDAGFSGLPGPVDSGSGFRPDAGSSIADAGSDARVTDASSGGSDAGVAPTPDASVAPTPDASVGATCNPLSCNNNCLLLPRCCNPENECACFSVLTQQCSLPSL